MHEPRKYLELPRGGAPTVDQPFPDFKEDSPRVFVLVNAGSLCHGDVERKMGVFCVIFGWMDLLGDAFSDIDDPGCSVFGIFSFIFHAFQLCIIPWLQTVSH